MKRAAVAYIPNNNRKDELKSSISHAQKAGGQQNKVPEWAVH